MCTHTTAAIASQPIEAHIPVRLAKPIATPARLLMLKENESIRIVDARGRALLDILSSEHGPVLQMVDGDTNLDVAGQLRIHADAIEMIARDGELKMLAKDDVIVRGEKVRLN